MDKWQPSCGGEYALVELLVAQGLFNFPNNKLNNYLVLSLELLFSFRRVIQLK